MRLLAIYSCVAVLAGCHSFDHVSGRVLLAPVSSAIVVETSEQNTLINAKVGANIQIKRRFLFPHQIPGYSDASATIRLRILQDFVSSKLHSLDLNWESPEGQISTDSRGCFAMPLAYGGQGDVIVILRLVLNPRVTREAVGYITNRRSQIVVYIPEETSLAGNTAESISDSECRSLSPWKN